MPKGKANKRLRIALAMPEGRASMADVIATIVAVGYQGRSVDELIDVLGAVGSRYSSMSG